jgi:hypothetical protein
VKASGGCPCPGQGFASLDFNGFSKLGNLIKPNIENKKHKLGNHQKPSVLNRKTQPLPPSIAIKYIASYTNQQRITRFIV